MTLKYDSSWQKYQSQVKSFSNIFSQLQLSSKNLVENFFLIGFNIVLIEIIDFNKKLNGFNRFLIEINYFNMKLSFITLTNNGYKEMTKNCVISLKRIVIIYLKVFLI